MTTKRGAARANVISHCAAICRDVEEAAARMRLIVHELKEKNLDEWTAVESLMAEALGLVHDLGFVDLHKKLVTFTVADLERQRKEGTLERSRHDSPLAPAAAHSPSSPDGRGGRAA